ncbi:MAG: hypothetical protein K2K90_19890 [Lachnospiraceae bacterium]|nr:hypothetical protein [Lachnospiraceae bacterium]
MIFSKVWQSLQNVHGITQRWIEHFPPNAEKRQSREILRLILHKYHGEETGTENRTDALKKHLPWKPKHFLHISWEVWKGRKWLSVICHPAFLQKQYSLEVLAGLCGFLENESLTRLEGIGQDLYFALCMAYGFFTDTDGMAAADRQAEMAAAPRAESEYARIKGLLAAHPNHREYVQDLQCWPDLIEERRFVSFCREAYCFWQNTGDKEQQDAFAESFPDMAEQWLLMSSLPDSDTEFILRNLCSLPHPLFSRQLSAKMQEYTHLCEKRWKFFQAFVDALDHTGEGHSVHERGYVPHMQRFDALKARYGSTGSWKKLLCSRGFQNAFRNWVLHPCYGSYVSSQPRYLEYYGWREVRSQFDGSSPFEEKLLAWLKTDLYFTEYEKRYQKELAWKGQQIEKAYFRELFPLPERSKGKLEVLCKVEQGKPIGAKKASEALSELYAYDETALRRLTQVTNSMVHFNFLLGAPKDREEAAWGDAVCFLEEEVLIYRREENGTCRLSHAAFFDMLAHIVDSKADCHLTHKKSFYHNEFIDTVCKNMYLYECYISGIKSVDVE